jgi:hypothetical protein
MFVLSLSSFANEGMHVSLIIVLMMLIAMRELLGCIALYYDEPKNVFHNNSQLHKLV